MMAKRSMVLLALLLLAVSLAAAGASAKEIKLPTWPQPFALGNGEQTSFLIPVTGAGSVIATAAWQGVPVSLTIIDGQGKVVATAPGRIAPKAVLEYRVVQQDLSRGPIWAITLATAKGR